MAEPNPIESSGTNPCGHTLDREPHTDNPGPGPPGDGCDGNAEQTVHDGSGDGHLGSSGDAGIDERTMTPPAAWTQSPNGSESEPSEPGADLAASIRAPTPPPFEDDDDETPETKPDVESSTEKERTLIRLDATGTVFSSADEATSEENSDDDLGAFLARFEDCPDDFDALALEHFLKVLEKHAPEAAETAIHQFIETTSAESYAVAVDLWAKWKQPELPAPGAPPANFLEVFKELFPL